MGTKRTLLSAVQPSNQLTLGNYLGALKPWVELQSDYECLFFAVDLHALTVRRDPQALRDQTYLALATYLAAGIDPENATLFVQSHVPQHAELAWILNCFSSMGELSRMTQFKDKSKKEGSGASAGLFTYPLLMAADILLYQTHLVPVGEDQKQHLELTRDLAIRINRIYSGASEEKKPALFVVPEIYTPPSGARIMSLQNPLVKMSKSDPDPQAAIYLTDTNDEILNKFKKAVTDSGKEICYDEQQPGIRNLIDILCALKGQSPGQIVQAYQGKQYGHLKLDTAECVIEALSPIREEVKRWMSDVGSLQSFLTRGAQTAQARAQRTLTEVYERMGFIPRG